MQPMYHLERFVAAQDRDYDTALSELRRGRKQSHWMWYIFPQVAGLGHSSTAQHYALKDIGEATAYVQHPVLGPRLVQLCHVLLSLPTSDAHQVFGSPDDMKLRSSMTLFAAVPGSDQVFEQVLDKFYGGEPDKKTLSILQQA